MTMQPHFKNKMTARRDKCRVEVLFILLELQGHVDVANNVKSWGGGGTENKVDSSFKTKH